LPDFALSGSSPQPSRGLRVLVSLALGLAALVLLAADGDADHRHLHLVVMVDVSHPYDAPQDARWNGGPYREETKRLRSFLAEVLKELAQRKADTVIRIVLFANSSAVVLTEAGKGGPAGDVEALARKEWPAAWKTAMSRLDPRVTDFRTALRDLPVFHEFARERWKMLIVSNGIHDVSRVSGPCESRTPTVPLKRRDFRAWAVVMVLVPCSEHDGVPQYPSRASWERELGKEMVFRAGQAGVDDARLAKQVVRAFDADVRIRAAAPGKLRGSGEVIIRLEADSEVGGSPAEACVQGDKGACSELTFKAGGEDTSVDVKARLRPDQSLRRGDEQRTTISLKPLNNTEEKTLLVYPVRIPDVSLRRAFWPEAFGLFYFPVLAAGSWGLSLVITVVLTLCLLPRFRAKVGFPNCFSTVNVTVISGRFPDETEYTFSLPRKWHFGRFVFEPEEIARFLGDAPESVKLYLSRCRGASVEILPLNWNEIYIRVGDNWRLRASDGAIRGGTLVPNDSLSRARQLEEEIPSDPARPLPAGTLLFTVNWPAPYRWLQWPFNHYPRLKGDDFPRHARVRRFVAWLSLLGLSVYVVLAMIDAGQFEGANALPNILGALVIAVGALLGWRKLSPPWHAQSELGLGLDPAGAILPAASLGANVGSRFFYAAWEVVSGVLF